MREPKIIERRLKPIDERMPLNQWYEEMQKQVDALPLEIVEDGISYEVFNVREEIKGYRNTAIIFYREKGARAKR